MRMRYVLVLVLVLGTAIPACDNTTSALSDAAVDPSGDAQNIDSTSGDAQIIDSTAAPDLAPTSRTLKGTIADPMVNKVAAIPERGKEIVAAVANGAFALSQLKTDLRYLLDFRNGKTSQGWLVFNAGTAKSWVIPRGTLPIDLGACKSDKNLSFTSTKSPLVATDDDGDGIVDAKDDYTPTPPTLPAAGNYQGRQLWNPVTYGVAFVPSSTDKASWKIFLSQLTAPACVNSMSGMMEKFGEGFIGLFQDQYLIAVDCKVHDHLQFRMLKQADGSYLGVNTHYLVGLDSTCVPQGCMGSPPHGGAYKMTRLGDTTCK